MNIKIVTETEVSDTYEVKKFSKYSAHIIVPNKLIGYKVRIEVIEKPKTEKKK